MPSAMTSQRLLAWLNYVYLLLVMLVIAGILTAAMTLQYANGELPCPLCLLERVAMLGVCFGIMLNFRRGFSYQNTGFSLLSAIFCWSLPCGRACSTFIRVRVTNTSAARSSASICRYGRSSLR